MANVSKEELLALIEDDFRSRCAEDATIQRLMERVGGDKVSYDDVQAYSKRLGQLLSKSYLALVTAEAFPEGLTLEVATAAIQKPLVDTFYEAASAATKYIETQNKAAGLGIKAIAPKHDAERVGHLATAVSKKPIEEARTLLEEPVVNHTMSAVDETVKANGRVMSKLGVGVKIIRRAVGSHTCDWCKGLAGSYDYNDVNQGGHDVWRRHAYCDCKIEYVSKADRHTVKNYVKGNQTANQRKVAARREARMPNDRSAEKVAERKNLSIPNNDERILIRKAATSVSHRGIIEKRKLAQGFRQPASRILTEEEINSVKKDAEALKIPVEILNFNTGRRTGFSDTKVAIGVCGDVLPDENSKQARDLMSPRAVLAHEYYGHYLHHPSEFEIDDWRDEFRASYRAAVDAPNLSNEDRAYLMIDAYDRAREAGEAKEYDKTARRIIYGF